MQASDKYGRTILAKISADSFSTIFEHRQTDGLTKAAMALNRSLTLIC